MAANDSSNGRTAQSLKPAKLTLDDLLAEKKQRDILQSEVMVMY